MSDGDHRRPTVFVSVGTDHHPFDRVVEWVDRWSARERDVDVFVQYGTSRAPREADGSDYLDYGDLHGRLQAAAVVVCHGGPSTIMEARRAGHLPIVVPRRPELGEHVDSHQVDFATRLSLDGEISLVQTEEELQAKLSEAIRHPALFKTAVSGDDRVTDTVRRFEETMDIHLPPEASVDRVPVLLLGGVGRSGSTLLDRMLGQVDGFCSAGEVVHVWLRGLKGDTLCGCGAPFSECPFWQKVGEQAFGGWERLDPDRMVALHRSLDRQRYLPELIAPRINPSYRGRLRSFAGSLSRLYSAVRATGSCNTIVDSSKHASYAFLLRHVPNVDLRVIHLVRDPRGVAYSWSKEVLRPEVTTTQVYMPRYRPSHLAARWVGYNLMFELLEKLGVPTLRVRYEDLVARPRETLEDILAFAGHVPDELDFIEDGRARLEVGHMVAGNPMRFEQGPIDLRLDDAWMRKMDPNARSIVTRLTRPLMRSYGYAISPEDR